MNLVIASENEGKIKAFKKILAPFDINLISKNSLNQFDFSVVKSYNCLL